MAASHNGRAAWHPVSEPEPAALARRERATAVRPRRSQLAFPPVTGLQERHPQVSDLDRICAASSITVLADTHPDIAVGLAGDLSADSGDPYEQLPVACAQGALAAMLVLQIGDISSRTERAGRSAGEELRDRLFGVLEAAGRNLDPDNRFRQSGDAIPGGERRRAILDDLATACLARTGGDWGDRTRHAGAVLARRLAGTDPEWALGHVGAYLGAFLNLIRPLCAPPAASVLISAGMPQQEPADRGLRLQFAATSAQKLLDAVAGAAPAGPGLSWQFVL